MTVMVPVALTFEEQTALLEQANAMGVSLDTLLHTAVVKIISTRQQRQPDLSPDELDRAFEEMADMIPESVPGIEDFALNRENIYTREDDW